MSTSYQDEYSLESNYNLEDIDLDNFQQVIEAKLQQIQDEPSYKEKLICKEEAGEEELDLEEELHNALDEIGVNEQDLVMVFNVAAKLYDQIGEMSQEMQKQETKINVYEIEQKQQRIDRSSFLQDIEKSQTLLQNLYTTSNTRDIDLNERVLQLETQLKRTKWMFQNSKTVNQKLKDQIKDRDSNIMKIQQEKQKVKTQVQTLNNHIVELNKMNIDIDQRLQNATKQVEQQDKLQRQRANSLQVINKQFLTKTSILINKALEDASSQNTEMDQPITEVDESRQSTIRHQSNAIDESGRMNMQDFVTKLDDINKLNLYEEEEHSFLMKDSSPVKPIEIEIQTFVPFNPYARFAPETKKSTTDFQDVINSIDTYRRTTLCESDLKLTQLNSVKKNDVMSSGEIKEESKYSDSSNPSIELLTNTNMQLTKIQSVIDPDGKNSNKQQANEVYYEKSQDSKSMNMDETNIISKLYFENTPIKDEISMDESKYFNLIDDKKFLSPIRARNGKEEDEIESKNQETQTPNQQEPTQEICTQTISFVTTCEAKVQTDRQPKYKRTKEIHTQTKSHSDLAEKVSGGTQTQNQSRLRNSKCQTLQALTFSQKTQTDWQNEKQSANVGCDPESIYQSSSLEVNRLMKLGNLQIERCISVDRSLKHTSKSSSLQVSQEQRRKPTSVCRYEQSLEVPKVESIQYNGDPDALLMDMEEDPINITILDSRQIEPPKPKIRTRGKKVQCNLINIEKNDLKIEKLNKKIETMTTKLIDREGKLHNSIDQLNQQNKIISKLQDQQQDIERNFYLSQTVQNLKSFVRVDKEKEDNYIREIQKLQNEICDVKRSFISGLSTTGVSDK